MTPTVTVLTERRYCDQAQPRGLIRALRRRGAHTIVIPDDRVASFRPRSSDVVVARGRSRHLLRALRSAEAEGVPTLDPAAAIASVRDKAVMSAALVSAGLPTPRTWSGTGADLAAAITRSGGSRCRLIAKPRLGDNGRGVRLIADAGEVAGCEEPLVVQEYLENDGADCKLYVVGRRVWVVRKPSPVSRCRSRRLGPGPVTEEHRALALACGQAFGLSIYGVDCVETAAGLAVIEVNDFPNFTSVPAADEHLAAHVLGRRP